MTQREPRLFLVVYSVGRCRFAHGGGEGKVPRVGGAPRHAHRCEKRRAEHHGEDQERVEADVEASHDGLPAYMYACMYWAQRRRIASSNQHTINTETKDGHITRRGMEPPAPPAPQKGWVCRPKYCLMYLMSKLLYVPPWAACRCPENGTFRTPWHPG